MHETGLEVKGRREMGQKLETLYKALSEARWNLLPEDDAKPQTEKYYPIYKLGWPDVLIL